MKFLADEILVDCSQNRQSAKINSPPKFPAIRYSCMAYANLSAYSMYDLYTLHTNQHNLNCSLHFKLVTIQGTHINGISYVPLHVIILFYVDTYMYVHMYV